MKSFFKLRKYMEKQWSNQEVEELNKFYEALDKEQKEIVDISETFSEKINTPCIKSKVNPEKEILEKAKA